MRRNIVRLVIAMCISAAGFFGTHVWYENGRVAPLVDRNQAVLARLVEHVNEVERRPLSQLMWEVIGQNENLHAGESIRTTSNSEARIMFLSTGAVIELEPDSEVIIEESADGIALDFLKGNLFVKSGTKGQDTGKGITLKSGNSKIALNKADISLSKAKESNKVDLQVFGGTAAVTQGDKTIQLDETKAGTLTTTGVKETEEIINILAPTPGEPVYFDPDKKETVTFTWEKLPKGYTVALLGGARRTKLKEINNVTANGETGTLSFLPKKVGKFYWQLVAKSSQQDLPERKSKTLPIELVAKTAPVPLSPAPNEKLALEVEQPNVEFNWTSPMPFENYFIEIATDSQLKEQVAKQSIEKTVTSFSFKPNKSGKYFWRITGYMKIKGQPAGISSGIQSFTAQVGIKLLPPELRSPVADQALPFQQVQAKGITFSWDSAAGAEKYRVAVQTVTKEGLSQPEVKEFFTSPGKWESMKPGTYRWTVTSLGAKNKISDPSPARQFTVNTLPKVNWVGGPEPSEFLYFTNKPYLQARWIPDVKGAKAWRVRFAVSGFLDEEGKWIKTDKPYIRKYVNGNGTFDVEVEALDDNGQVIARSSVKQIVVKEKPLLPPPSFAKNIPEVIKSDKSGNLDVQWLPVDGAESYQVILQSPDGKVLQEKKVTRSLASLNKLKPGNYKVSVKAIDKHNRPSKAGDTKEVNVPKVSNIAAPKIRNIKVK
ncbi:MAG: hypothetical protein H6626_05525 [Pseudobdellovibrionaceae bacterium]|nr:hypothetical protein [Bdellovibrionales bacterium]USN48554.1 MAG: hypothetical protein H6626_05525 [Pseudobdellovibrionaceae bacterium]